MLGSAFRKHIGPPVAVFGLLVGIVAITAFLYVALAPNAHAYVGPRPTVEQVKIFACNYDASCAENLESGVNEWLKKNSGSIRIVDRKFIMADRGCYAIAIFYEKLPEQPPGKKQPAEAP